jgi:hypothetical protein
MTTNKSLKKDKNVQQDTNLRLVRVKIEYVWLRMRELRMHELRMRELRMRELRMRELRMRELRMCGYVCVS